MGGDPYVDVAGRRHEVKELAGEGFSLRQIADRVGVSYETVRRDLAWMERESAERTREVSTAPALGDAEAVQALDGFEVPERPPEDGPANLARFRAWRGHVAVAPPTESTPTDPVATATPTVRGGQRAIQTALDLQRNGPNDLAQLRAAAALPLGPSDLGIGQPTEPTPTATVHPRCPRCGQRHEPRPGPRRSELSARSGGFAGDPTRPRPLGQGPAHDRALYRDQVSAWRYGTLDPPGGTDPYLDELRAELHAPRTYWWEE